MDVAKFVSNRSDFWEVLYYEPISSKYVIFNWATTHTVRVGWGVLKGAETREEFDAMMGLLVLVNGGQEVDD